MTFSKLQEKDFDSKEQILSWYREEIITAKTYNDHIHNAELELTFRQLLGIASQ